MISIAFSTLALAAPASSTTSYSNAVAAKFQARIVVEVDQPVALVERQISDNGAYIVSQQGRIFFWKYNSKALTKVLDITSLTSAKGERGLLGLTFRKGFAYVNYTNKAGDTVIAEYALTKTGEFDAKSRRELLVIKQPYSNHNGGAIITGRDNMLYIGTGDGGSKVATLIALHKTLSQCLAKFCESTRQRHRKSDTKYQKIILMLA